MWGVSSNYPSISSYGAAKETYEKTKPLRGQPDFRPLDQRSSRAKAQILKENDAYIIRLYNTDIVRYKPDGEVVLHTGGWASTSTAAAMSAMSPFAVWNKKGSTIVRMPDLKKYWIPRAGTGLTIKDGQPVNPVPATVSRTRVRKDKTKLLRKYFAEVPKLIESLSALLAEKPKLDLPKLDGHPFNKYGTGNLLTPEDVAFLALKSLKTKYEWSAGINGVANNPKQSIAAFWRDVYNDFECVEQYTTQLPLGEV